MECLNRLKLRFKHFSDKPPESLSEYLAALYASCALLLHAKETGNKYQVTECGRSNAPQRAIIITGNTIDIGGGNNREAAASAQGSTATLVSC